MTSARRAVALAALPAILMTAGCMVGPKYHKPDVPVTPAFKEPFRKDGSRPNQATAKLAGSGGRHMTTRS